MHNGEKYNLIQQLSSNTNESIFFGYLQFLLDWIKIKHIRIDNDFFYVINEMFLHFILHWNSFKIKFDHLFIAVAIKFSGIEKAMIT